MTARVDEMLSNATPNKVARELPSFSDEEIADVILRSMEGGLKRSALAERDRRHQERVIAAMAKKEGDDRWWKKPVGIVFLSVTAGLLLLAIGALLRHILPIWFY
jgi:hypothetical protein